MKKHIPNPAIIFRRLHWPPVYFLTGSFKRKAVILLLMISSFSLSGCFKNFYQTNTKNSASDSEAMKALKDPNKYFIVHFKDAELALNNIAASDSIIEGDVTEIENTLEDPSRLVYPSAPANSTRGYKRKYKAVVLQEVHIYTTENYLPQKREHIRLPASSVSRVDIYTKNKGLTTLNHVLSITGVVAGVLSITGLVWLAILSTQGGFLWF